MKAKWVREVVALNREDALEEGIKKGRKEGIKKSKKALIKELPKLVAAARKRRS